MQLYSIITNAKTNCFMRFNPFNIIHKALRALMYDTDLTLQQTYFADVEEAETALAKVNAVVEQFERHAYHEDNFVLPAIQSFAPQMVEAFEHEHVEDNAIGECLKHLINVFEATKNDEERLYAGSAITKTFREFMVFNLNHMAKEELEITHVLWQHYTDQQLIEMNAKLSASIPAEEKAFTSKWMMRAINRVDAIGWLNGVKHSAPKHVFQSLVALAEAEMPAPLSEAVQEAVLGYEMA
jgi:hemerythrin-like domain-containing protein